MCVCVCVYIYIYIYIYMSARLKANMPRTRGRNTGGRCWVFLLSMMMKRQRGLICTTVRLRIVSNSICLCTLHHVCLPSQPKHKTQHARHTLQLAHKELSRQLFLYQNLKMDRFFAVQTLLSPYDNSKCSFPYCDVCSANMCARKKVNIYSGTQNAHVVFILRKDLYIPSSTETNGSCNLVTIRQPENCSLNLELMKVFGMCPRALKISFSMHIWQCCQ